MSAVGVQAHYRTSAASNWPGLASLGGAAAAAAVGGGQRREDSCNSSKLSVSFSQYPSASSSLEQEHFFSFFFAH